MCAINLKKIFYIYRTTLKPKKLKTVCIVFFFYYKIDKIRSIYYIHIKKKLSFERIVKNRLINKNSVVVETIFNVLTAALRLNKNNIIKINYLKYIIR